MGTRNFVVVLAVTSRANGFARHAAEQAARRAPPGVDGVVAVTHTEGGGGPRPNNLDYVLRVLAGFMVHPNVGAVLAVDDGAGSYTSADLERFMSARGYPLDHVVHAFLRIDGGYETEVARGRRSHRRLAARGRPEPCAPRRRPGRFASRSSAGGSDAFSGVSGNALAGWVAKEVIRHGGSANLAETDELIGAEPYVLESVRDAATAPPLPRQGRELQAVCREPRRHRRGQSVGGATTSAGSTTSLSSRSGRPARRTPRSGSTT